MKIQKAALLFILIFAAGGFAYAQSTDSSGNVTNQNFSIYGRLQMMGLAQSVLDKVQSDKRIYLFLKQARLGVHSNYDDIKLDFETAFGGEEVVAAPSPGVSLQLLDFSIDVPLAESLRLKVGQFKVPYGREEFEDEGSIMFGDRSIQYNAFVIGRDVGMALYGSSDSYSGTLGVFTGGGRDVPLRYLPEKLGFPMVVLRLGYNDGYDTDPLYLRESGYNMPNGTAIYLNGLYIRDFRIGHSTVLNVKTIDKSLLLDSYWNPYIGVSPLDQGRFWQIGADAAFRQPFAAGWQISGEAEINHGGYTNTYGSLSVTGGRAQLALSSMPYELGIRYAFIIPDSRFAYLASNHQSYHITSDELINEITLGITYYIKGDRLKVTADLPLLFQVPIMDDPVSGSYVLTQQPDQVSYISTGGNVVRENVVQARLQLQYAF
jgi:hypothetical protein